MTDDKTDAVEKARIKDLVKSAVRAQFACEEVAKRIERLERNLAAARASRRTAMQQEVKAREALRGVVGPREPERFFTLGGKLIRVQHRAGTESPFVFIIETEEIK